MQGTWPHCWPCLRRTLRRARDRAPGKGLVCSVERAVYLKRRVAAVGNLNEQVLRPENIKGCATVQDPLGADLPTAYLKLDLIDSPCRTKDLLDRKGCAPIANEVQREAVFAVTGQIGSAQGVRRAALRCDLPGLEYRDQVGFRDEPDT